MAARLTCQMSMPSTSVQLLSTSTVLVPILHSVLGISCLLPLTVLDNTHSTIAAQPSSLDSRVTIYLFDESNLMISLTVQIPQRHDRSGLQLTSYLPQHVHHHVPSYDGHSRHDQSSDSPIQSSHQWRAHPLSHCPSRSQCLIHACPPMSTHGAIRYSSVDQRHY